MRALIFGVCGQDGAYLSKLLLGKGYDVIGTTRDITRPCVNLNKLGIEGNLTILSLSLTEIDSIVQVMNNYKPDEIYYLAGQSSVGFSFEAPLITIKESVAGVLNVLEVIRRLGLDTKLFFAGSSESFGDTNLVRADEDTCHRPLSPYAIAKASMRDIVRVYRDSYNIYACTGILFNHESPLRPETFVTQKIIKTVVNISTGHAAELRLGNIGIERDWGWAPEYVDAMWKMLQLQSPSDFVIATGKTTSLEFFVQSAFNYFNLDYKKYLVLDKNLYRPADIKVSKADPGRASKILNWQAKVDIDELVRRMCQFALQEHRHII